MFEIHKYCNDLKVIRHWLIALILLFVANTLNAQAKFTAKNTKGCTPLTVAFVDLSVGAVSWSWDLGNGNTSVLQNPSAADGMVFTEVKLFLAGYMFTL